MQDLPLVKDIVLVGGGHAHALVLRMWGMDPLPGVRLTVINPDPVAPYTGMLPGLIAGHYRREEILIDLVRLARFAGARVILDRAVGLDPDQRLVHLAGRPPVAYDLASLDIGISSDLPTLPGFAENTFSAKPLGAYARTWEAFVSRALPSPKLVIIGGGIGGVELALASAHRLRATGAQPDITLLDRQPELLANLGQTTRTGLLNALAQAGVTILTSAQVLSATAEAVHLQDGRSLPSDFSLTVAGSRPQGWLSDIGLTQHHGFIAVDATLRSSNPLIFAAGDCAHLSHAPRPKAGVFAVRAAPVLHHNLRASLTGQKLRDYQPQRDYLKLVSLGGKSALADKWGLRAGGPWLWRLKDRIDRKFMAKFADYPAMATPALPNPAVQGLVEALGDKPLCGGCGAKVGAEGLAALARALPAPQRAEVLTGPGDDAAILKTAEGVQVLTTDHLRTFTCDPRLMAQLTAIHALGDIWAMGAAPQVALAQIVLPRLSGDMQARMLEEVMAAAAQVFRAAGADVVGGHTSQGAELTVGFTVTGTCLRPISKGGAQPGDALILTKPLGSGTILAAEMAMARPAGMMMGEVLRDCLTTMQRPLAEASRLLTPQAHAMTDVTGFGLAGHLMEMMEASATAARLWPEAVPLMPGAEALAAMGERSSLAPTNRAALLGKISGQDLTTPRNALLFDPQTCGGLLAAVPKGAAEAVLTALLEAGEEAAIIGEVVSGSPALVLSDRPVAG